MTKCLLDTVRSFDPATREWVYEVACVADECDNDPHEGWEMFRKPQESK